MKCQNNLHPIYRKLCSDHHRCRNNNMLFAGHCFKATQFINHSPQRETNFQQWGLNVRIWGCTQNLCSLWCWSRRISVSSLRLLHTQYMATVKWPFIKCFQDPSPCTLIPVIRQPIKPCWVLYVGSWVQGENGDLGTQHCLKRGLYICKTWRIIRQLYATTTPNI